MDRPLEITFHGIAASADIEAEIRRHVEKLEKRFPRLVGCRVSVQALHRQHHVGNVPEVHILLSVPGKDIAVSHEPGGRSLPAIPILQGSVRDAFDAAERQLESHKWEPREGLTLREVVLAAGAIRFKPILLTALSAMIGAATILTDPIFQGLAISLLFGLASSTLLTVLVIPAIYMVLRDGDEVRARPPEPAG